MYNVGQCHVISSDVHVHYPTMSSLTRAAETVWQVWRSPYHIDLRLGSATPVFHGAARLQEGRCGTARACTRCGQG